MRYLTLSADFGHASLRDLDSTEIDLDAIELPRELREAIAGWNERYQVVIPVGMSEREAEPMAPLIAELDETGVALAARVELALSGGAEVRYYSEGLLRHL